MNLLSFRCCGFALGLRLVCFRVVTLLLELSFLRLGDEGGIFGFVECGSIGCSSRFRLLGNIEGKFGVLGDRGSGFGS